MRGIEVHVLTRFRICRHDNILANIKQFLQMESKYFTPENRHLGVLPCFHMFALNLILHVPFYTRTPVYLLPRFDLAGFCNTIQKQKITFSCCVPPMLLLLAKSPEVLKYDLSSLLGIIVGAAPLDADLTRAVIHRLPQVRIKQGYGLTETSPVTSFQPDYQIVDGKSNDIWRNMKVILNIFFRCYWYLGSWYLCQGCWWRWRWCVSFTCMIESCWYVMDRKGYWWTRWTLGQGPSNYEGTYWKHSSSWLLTWKGVGIYQSSRRNCTIYWCWWLFPHWWCGYYWQGWQYFHCRSHQRTYQIQGIPSCTCWIGSIAGKLKNTSCVRNKPTNMYV